MWTHRVPILAKYKDSKNDFIRQSVDGFLTAIQTIKQINTGLIGAIGLTQQSEEGGRHRPSSDCEDARECKEFAERREHASDGSGEE